MLFIYQFCTRYIAWTILGSYILISYGESPHETEAANQYWPIKVMKHYFMFIYMLYSLIMVRTKDH